VPVAHANDGGGSIRIPAACCGLVGLKPQRGRVSLAPTLGHAFLVQDGVLTRTVRETALLLDVLAGPEVGDVAWAPPPPDPFAAAAARAPGPRRVAWTTRPPIPDAVVDPVCVQAVPDAAALLRELGHEVVEAEPPWGDPAVEDLFAASFGPGIAASIRATAMLAGRAPTAEDVEPLSWWLYERAAALDAPSALMAELALHAVGRALVTWTSGFDAVLTPALAQAPLPLGTIDPLGPDPAGTFARSARFTPFTPPLNISGQPAIALPLFARPDGLPLAVQLIGAPAQEGALLALAAQLEAAHPWSGRRAPL
jgi:amidase